MVLNALIVCLFVCLFVFISARRVLYFIPPEMCFSPLIVNQQ